MTDKKLVLLGLIAVVMVALAVWAMAISPEEKSGVSDPTYLVQGLDPDNIAKIEIKAGDDIVTLTQVNGDFVVDEKDEYPVLASKINRILSDVMDIKTVELYTDNASNHADLAVTEETASYVVKFYDSEGIELTGLIVGKEKDSGDGTFVRLISDDRVYLTLDRLYLSSSPVSYLDQSLLSLATDQIDWVNVEDNDLSKYMLKNSKDEIIFVPMPEDKQIDETQARGVLNALSSLRFEDVFKDGKKELKFDRKYVCMMNDSTRYTIQIATEEDKTYIKVDSEFTDNSQITVTRGGNESEEELKAKEAKLLARDDAIVFSNEHEGWVYEISDYIAENLMKPAADLLKDKPRQAIIPAVKRREPEEDAVTDIESAQPDEVNIDELAVEQPEASSASIDEPEDLQAEDDAIAEITEQPTASEPVEDTQPAGNL